MISTPLKILDEIRAGKLIRNLSYRELNSPDGVGFDLCLKSISELEDESGSLLIKTRKTPSSKKLEDGSGFFVLEPGKTYLATTAEEFELTDGLAAIFFPRSTLFRSGIIFQSSVLPPGYIGPMTFSLTNFHSKPFSIEKGARFAHVTILETNGAVDLYRGQWQGGRVSQPKDEDQI
ncbi:Deoxycytidine triphosphate deaminase [compost metagenome]